MRSAQYSTGLDYLAQGNYAMAATKFKIMLLDIHDKDPNKKAFILYFHAVACLGELLKNLAKEPKEFKNIQIEPNAIPIKKSFFERMGLALGLITSDIKENKQEAIRKSHQNEITKTIKELQTIETLFLTAKKAFFHANLEGIEYAINYFIKNLYSINQNIFNDRIELFSKELKKFQLFYLIKSHVSLKLAAHENEYHFSFLIPKQVKKLRHIFNQNQTDPLFLSYDQIDQLYMLLQNYKYNKKYDYIFQSLEKYMSLPSLLYGDKDYFKIVENHNFSIDNVNLLKEIYNDIHLNELKIIINELEKFNLLNDKIIKNIGSLIRLSNNYRYHLNILVDVINTSPTTEKHKLLLNLFNFVLERIPHDRFHDYQFNKYKSYIKNSCITDNDIDTKKIYLYLDLFLFFNSTEHKVILHQVCNLMQETETAIGNENFILICQKVFQYKLSYNDFLLLLKLALPFNKYSAINLLQIIDEHYSDLHILKDKANDFLLKEHQFKFPERSLDSVIHDFQIKSNDVEFPLDPDELKELESRYIEMQKIGEQLMSIRRDELLLKLKDSQNLLAADPKNEIAKLTLLAIIRIHVKDKLGIYPYNVQMLNLMALLNQPKRIAQIKTGEGKSTLIAMLSAYFALQNHNVDIITTSNDLAIRDAKKFDSFYRTLGISIGLNTQKNTYWHKNAVVYGTVSAFEFSYLRGETQDSSNGRGDRSYDVVIGDEVDSMFIDMQRNEAILSRVNENAYEAKIYELIWEWINKTDIEDQTSGNLQAMLKSSGTEVSHELASTWLRSAHTAQRFTEEKEYIVDFPDSKSLNKDKNNRIIKIVNKSHTGEIAGEATRWQGGLHEFLEVKHKLQVHVESLTIASISHIEYFNKYPILIGLTGTLGSKASRDELHQLYKVSTYDSPPYKLSQKVELTHIIEADEKAQMIAIEKVVQQQINAGRPVLTLSESIQESKFINKQLAKTNKSSQIYNGVQTLSADAVLALAGNPSMVTNATNLAGRGADIVTTPDAEFHGGLHVIMTFPANNKRVEQQAFGRTGRQGKKGTYQYILREDQLSETENKGKTTEEKIELIRNNREIRQKIISADNIYNYNIMHKLFILQTLFFSLPIKIKSNHMNEWAVLKTDMNKYATQYIHGELDDINEDNVMLNILEKFNKFWKIHLSTYGNDYKTPLDFVKKSYKWSDDVYIKKIMLENMVFFENPKIDFSNEVSDLLIELKELELPPEEKTSSNKSNFMHFHRTKEKSNPKDLKFSYSLQTNTL